MNDPSIVRLHEEIAALENALAGKKHQLEQAEAASCADAREINNRSPPEAKIALFRSLFQGRQDVYAKRFESKKTGKSGYQPVCRNEWAAGVCEKPRTKCGNCSRRDFEPVTEFVIKNHLEGLRRTTAVSFRPPPRLVKQLSRSG